MSSIFFSRAYRTQAYCLSLTTDATTYTVVVHVSLRLSAIHLGVPKVLVPLSLAMFLPLRRFTEREREKERERRELAYKIHSVKSLLELIFQAEGVASSYAKRQIVRFENQRDVRKHRVNLSMLSALARAIVS